MSTPNPPQSVSAKPFTSALSGGAGASVATSTDRVRKQIRLHSDTAERVAYWADRHELVENEYLCEAVEEKIARENGDYDLPTLEQNRLNQLIDEIKALSTNAKNLEGVVVSGFGSLLGLTRGDNYLLNDEDGELNSGDDASAAAGA